MITQATARQFINAAAMGDAKAMDKILRALIEGEFSPQSNVVTLSDAATYTVLAENSGKTHVIPELTASCTIDLPAAADGLEYVFIMGGIATEAQNWIFDTQSAAAYYVGGLQFLDSDEPGAGATLVPVYPDGNSNDIMTIITPQAGTRVHVVCNGTTWIVNGVVFSATAPTFAD